MVRRVQHDFATSAGLPGQCTWVVMTLLQRSHRLAVAWPRVRRSSRWQSLNWWPFDVRQVGMIKGVSRMTFSSWLNLCTLESAVHYKLHKNATVWPGCRVKNAQKNKSPVSLPNCWSLSGLLPYFMITKFCTWSWVVSWAFSWFWVAEWSVEKMFDLWGHCCWQSTSLLQQLVATVEVLILIFQLALY